MQRFFELGSIALCVTRQSGWRPLALSRLTSLPTASMRHAAYRPRGEPCRLRRSENSGSTKSRSGRSRIIVLYGTDARLQQLQHHLPDRARR